MLDREEYIEQAYFFRSLGERLLSTPAQEALAPLKEELLASAKLPMAIDFIEAELRLNGAMAGAFASLKHYFTPFQTFVVAESENDHSKFDLRLGLEILERDAAYRALGATPQGVFLYEFECLCRNRLGYDAGLEATAGDPIFDEDWREWIFTVRRQVGLVEIADLVYVRSAHYWNQLLRRGASGEPPKPLLFGEREGKIAGANRRKDPLLLFAALQRHLNYPAAPRPRRVDESPQMLASLARRLERLEAHVKLVEEDMKGGVDLARFMGPNAQGMPTNET